MVGLGITYGQLRREVGRYLGFDRDSANWTADEAQDVNDVLDSGLRQFYFPPRLDGDTLAHQWNFLQPQVTLTLVVDQDDYDMPAEFAGFVGDVHYVNESWAPTPLRLVNEAKILQLRSSELNDSSGYYPRYAALVAKSSDETAAQVYQLQIWPSPDAAYTLIYRYFIRPQTDKADANVPLGGPEHAEAIRSSVIAAAESHLDDERGAKYARFLDMLRAAVDFDMKANAPTNLGQNSDPSTYATDGGGYIRSPRITQYDKFPL